MIDKIIDYYEDESFLKVNGFDEAIIGVDTTQMRLVYSVTKCLQVLMITMSEEDAIEHFFFNISDAYLGEKTPVWCYDNFE